jgi:hypothetical protein
VIIFSRRDYRYLGNKTTAPGQPVSGSALVRFAITDSLPPHVVGHQPVPAKRPVKGSTAGTPAPGGSRAP